VIGVRVLSSASESMTSPVPVLVAPLDVRSILPEAVASSVAPL